MRDFLEFAGVLIGLYLLVEILLAIIVYPDQTTTAFMLAVWFIGSVVLMSIVGLGFLITTAWNALRHRGRALESADGAAADARIAADHDFIEADASTPPPPRRATAFHHDHVDHRGHLPARLHPRT